MSFLGSVNGFQNLKAGAPIEFDALTIFIFWVIGFGPLVFAILGISALMAHLYKKRTGHSFFKFQKKEDISWRGVTLAFTRLLAVIVLFYLAIKFFPLFWRKPLFTIIFIALLVAVALFMFIKNKQDALPIPEKKSNSKTPLGTVFFSLVVVSILFILLYYYWLSENFISPF